MDPLTIGAIFALTAIAVAVMMPKPQTRPPAEFEDIKAPVAEEGKEIPVLFGTRMLRGPNVVWYGDFDTKAIKKKGGKK